MLDEHALDEILEQDDVPRLVEVLRLQPRVGDAVHSRLWTGRREVSFEHRASARWTEEADKGCGKARRKVARLHRGSAHLDIGEQRARVRVAVSGVRQYTYSVERRFRRT
jgi:hypothetical protein